MSTVHTLDTLRDSLPPTERMPLVFLGHGSPMNAIEDNAYSRAWSELGRKLPHPKAILVVSAHWMTRGTTLVDVSAMPRTIHDFYGFPPRLYEVDYPAPGSPELAQEVADVAAPDHVGLDRDGWGLDHGTWSLLVHAFPAADVPVVQLSIHAQRDLAYHLELGARLSPLRQRGVLVLGSGNLVHNLRELDWASPDSGFDWARRFDDAAFAILTRDPGDVLALASHADYRRSVPTTEHFLPLVYVAGLARAAGRPLQRLVDGCAYGSLSMAAYTLDAPPSAGGPDDQRPAAGLPDPAVVPPQDANV